MKTRIILLLFTIFLLTQTLLAQINSSSVIIRTVKGTHIVSGVVSDEATRNEIVSKIKAELGNNVNFAALKIDSAAEPFYTNWQNNFDKLLSGAKRGKNNLIVFNKSANTSSNDFPVLPENVLNYDVLLTGNRKVKLANFQDKLVLLNFIEQWAAPCRVLIVELSKIHKEFFSDVEIIGVSTETEESEKTAFNSFVKKNRLKFKTGWIDKSFYEYFFKVSKINAVPQTFVIYKGKLRGVFVGASAKANQQLKKLVQEIVENEIRK